LYNLKFPISFVIHAVSRQIQLEKKTKDDLRMDNEFGSIGDEKFNILMQYRKKCNLECNESVSHVLRFPSKLFK